MDRQYTLYEAREIIKQKEARIRRILEENTKLLIKIKELEDWNIQWQTKRWDMELAKQCRREKLCRRGR